MRRSSLLVALFVLACSSSDGGGDRTGSGGSAGSGGGAGSAGTAGSAGSGGGAGSGGSGGGAGSGGSGGGGSADTWDSYAMGFFSTYCTDCHGAGDAQRDYTTIDEIVRDKNAIRCGVGTMKYPGCLAFPPPRQFPIGTGPKPSDAERERLVAWIDAGAS